jgi:integrase
VREGRETGSRWAWSASSGVFILIILTTASNARSANGRCIRKSLETDNEREAARILKDLEGRAVRGEPILPRVNKITYNEIAEDLRTYYRTTGKRNLTEAGKRLAHLDAYFKGWRLVAIDPSRITAYVEHRQKPVKQADCTVTPRASNGTINRELAVLSRMLRLAYENGKLLRVSVIRKLKEAPPRAGFFEQAQFQAVRKHLPDDVQTAVTVAYTYGWRMQSEVLALERRHLDLEAGTLTLDPGMTKNGEPRTASGRLS